MKLDLLIVPAIVLPMDQSCRVVEETTVGVADGRICHVGPDPRDRPDAEVGEVLEAPDCALIPGLINAHTHLGDTLFRGIVADGPLEGWLQALWDLERRYVTPESVAAAAEVSILEMVRGGITAVVDMFWYPEAAAEAACNLGFRLATGPLFLQSDAVNPYAAKAPLATEELFDRIDASPLLHAVVQPHSLYTLDEASLRAAVALAGERDCRLHIHAAETRAENETVRERWGDTPIRSLHKLGILDENLLIAHAIHLDAEERSLLASSGAVAIPCPVSECRLGSGVFAFAEMCDLGVRIALGTDSAVSARTLDLWAAMRTGVETQRGTLESAEVLPAGAVAALATRIPGDYIFDEQTGVIAVGRRADLVLVERDKIHQLPSSDPLATLVGSTRPGDVKATIIQGKTVFTNGEYPGIDAERIRARFSALHPA